MEKHARLHMVEVGHTGVELSIENFLLDCRSRNLSYRTIELNTSVLAEFFAFVVVDSPDDVTTIDIRRYLARKSETASKATARRYYTVLRSFFKFLLTEGLLRSNPVTTVSPPKAPTPVIEPLDAESLSALLSVTEGKDFVSLRNRVLLLLLIDGGLRASEVCGITLADVDFDNQVVVVKHGKGDKPRIVPFGSVTALALTRSIHERGSRPVNRRISAGSGTN